MTRWTIDSIEEGVAAVEDENGRMIHLPAALLPDAARPGDVISVERRAARGGASVTLRVSIDREATERAYRQSERQLRRKPGKRAIKDRGGDIEL